MIKGPVEAAVCALRGHDRGTGSGGVERDPTGVGEYRLDKEGTPPFVPVTIGSPEDTRSKTVSVLSRLIV